MTGLAIAYLVDAAVGLFAALVVFSQVVRRRANLWLGLFVASCALASLQGAVDLSPLPLEHPDTVNWLEPLMLAVGPCLYAYVRAFTGRPVSGRRVWIHFIPAALLFLLVLRWHLTLDSGQKAWALIVDRQGPKILDPVHILNAIQLLMYLVGSLRYLAHRSEQLKGVFSNLDRISFRWLRRLLWVTLVLYLVWVPTIGPGNQWAQAAVTVAFPLALYLLAWCALEAPEVFARGPEGPSLPPEVTLEAPSAAVPDPLAEAGEEEMEGEKYRKARLPDALLIRYQDKLQVALETRKGFLDSELNLARLADQVGISPHHLSQVLNERLGLRFCDYVNALRLKEAQRLLLDPAPGTVLEVAMRAGFSSKATFNGVFKRATGMTPTAWRELRLREKVV